MMRIGVVGGGPSGLSVAWDLKRRAEASDRDVELVVFEAQQRPGGKAWTESESGYQVEVGPEGFLDSSPRTLEVARELGIAERILPASPGAKSRFLFVDGKLQRLPMSPPAMLRSGLLSLSGRLRVFLEAFQPRSKAEDESIASFARRRLGREAAHKLVGSMVSGVHAGDPEQLSMPAAFPRMVQMEQEYGSLTRALIAKMRKARREGGELGGGPAGPGGHLTSFEGGMKDLVRAYSECLGDRVRYQTPVASVRRYGESWELRLEEGGAEIFDRLVVATEPWQAATLVNDLDPSLASDLSGIKPASITVVALGYHESDLTQPNEGFGFLAPRGEGLRILGCIWSSSIFPNRAPEGRVLLRVMIGGATDPAATDTADDELTEIVLRDLERSMHLKVQPDMLKVIRWRRGIPQYTLGHLERLRRVDARLESHAGLFLHGNGYRGISLNDCVKWSQSVADRVLGPSALGSDTVSASTADSLRAS